MIGKKALGLSSENSKSFLFWSQATKSGNGLVNKKRNGVPVPVPVPGSPGAAPAVPEMFQPYMMAAAQQMQQLQKTLHQNAAVAAARIAQVKQMFNQIFVFPLSLFFSDEKSVCCLIFHFSGATFQPRRGSPARHPTRWCHALPRSAIWIPQLRVTRLPCCCKAASYRYDI